MTAVSFESAATTHNPIDLVEEVVLANEWAHDRASDEEMVVEIAGRWCSYRLFFVWQEDVSAMHFSCAFDMKVPKSRRADVCELLCIVNEKMWLGHFDLCADESSPLFRYTVLLRGSMGLSIEQLEDLVEISLTECERFFPAFQLVVESSRTPTDAIDAAMIEPVGEA